VRSCKTLSGATLLRYYVHGKSYIDERAVMRDAADDVDYYYTLKDLYTVDALVNNRGHEVERVTYDAYGMPVMRAIRTTDVDYNGTVNAVDLGLVQAATDPCTDGPMLDIDGNGTINATDQGLVQSSYGPAVAMLYTSGLGNAYFFTGRRMHHFDSNLIDLGPAPNTAMQYNRARHYDPEHGRWLQRDSLGYSDSMNVYEYVKGSPGRYVDHGARSAGQPQNMASQDSPAVTPCNRKSPSFTFVGCDQGTVARAKQVGVQVGSMWCDIVDCIDDPAHSMDIYNCFRHAGLGPSLGEIPLIDYLGAIRSRLVSFASSLNLPKTPRIIECCPCNTLPYSTSGPMHTPNPGLFGTWMGQPIRICNDRSGIGWDDRHKFSHELMRWFVGDSRWNPWDNVERWDEAIACAFNYAIGKCGSTKNPKSGPRPGGSE
jgi:hypothetical protein